MDKQKEPRLISFDVIGSLVGNIDADRKEFVVGEDYAVMYHCNRLVHDVFEMNTPYRFKESRIMMVVSGEADVTINLLSYHLHSGMMVLLMQGGVMQIRSRSDDYLISGIAFSEDYLSRMSDTRLAKAVKGRYTEVVFTLNDDETMIAEQYLTLVWQSIRRGICSRELLATQIASIIYFLKIVMERSSNPATDVNSHADELFSRFINLVNQHHATQRSLKFYADELCITTTYLCLIAKKSSGFTPKDWIDRALVTSAKVMLKRTDDPIVHIAYNLGFSESSAFCKFFKRMTGVTPLEYREN